MKNKVITKKVDSKKGKARKMSAAELEMFLHFKKRGFAVPAKKGKGSYNRKKLKKQFAA